MPYLEETYKLFKVLPEDIKECLLSEETAKTIGRIGEKRGIKEENISKLAKLVGDVLIGLLAPNNLPGKLEKELAVDGETAEDIFQEVKRFILFSVKRGLAELYDEEFFSAAKKIEKKESAINGKQEKSSDDTYREVVE